MDESAINRYLEIFSAMREDDFSKEILKPLFEGMGYFKVDFHGGVNELGRDLIAQIKSPPRLTPKVIYVQTKKIGNKKASEIAPEFSRLIHQLRQCYKTPFVLSDGQKVLANEIYLASPYSISARLMEQIQSELSDQSQPVILLDGPQIIELMKEYCGELLTSLLNFEDKLNIESIAQVNNEELFSALSHNKSFNFLDCYNDLTFFVGSVDSNLLFSLSLIFTSNSIKVDFDEWKVFRRYIEAFEKKHSIKITMIELNQIENDLIEKQRRYESPENKKKFANLSILTSKSEVLSSEIKSQRSDLLKALTVALKDDNSNDISDVINIVKKNFDIDIHENFKSLIGNESNSNLPKKIKDFIEKVIKTYKEYCVVCNEIDGLKSKIHKPPFHDVVINIELLQSKLLDNSSRYQSAIRKINANPSKSLEIKRFLIETESSLSFVKDIIANNSKLNEIFIAQQSSDKSIQDRVSISPLDIFSTGQDIAVYGGAGVGKTTTLQMYSSKFTSSQCEALIYLPLNKFIDGYKKIEKTNFFEGRKKYFRILVLVLLSKKLPETIENVLLLDTFIKSRKVTLILDGLDEIYNTFKEIIDSIVFFKEEYPHTQLIISSRDCVTYLDSIPFLGITLLPFTKDQLFSFIQGWFRGKEIDKSQELIQTIKEQNIYEYVKTPLLVTILCMLVERGVKPPTSEVEIYSQRLKLLTGEYDKFKRINRQKNDSDMLIKIAMHLAYRMHEYRLRSADKEHLISLITGSLLGKFEEQLTRSCIDELIDPCNILVRDPVSNTYSFGHFRFQEHLVARAISIYREIDIIEKTTSDWYRGALCLYAQENNFIDLIEDIYKKYSNIRASELTLREMIKFSAPEKRLRLNEVLRMFINSDYRDEASFIDDYSMDIDLYNPW